jgi:hypothetical protein
VEDFIKKKMAQKELRDILNTPHGPEKASYGMTHPFHVEPDTIAKLIKEILTFDERVSILSHFKSDYMAFGDSPAAPLPPEELDRRARLLWSYFEDELIEVENRIQKRIDRLLGYKG